jgi:hypothetical protein
MISLKNGLRWGMRCAIYGFLPLLLACDGGGGSDDQDQDSLVIENIQLRNRVPDECEVFGTMLNTDGEKACDGCVSFNAVNIAGDVIDDSIDCVTAVPPNTRVGYSAPFIFTRCSSIARVEQTDLTQFCD